MKNQNNKEYTCAACGNTYEKGVSDEEANEEAKEIWGVEKANERDDFDIICDDCFNKQTPEEIKTMGEEYQRNKK